VRFGRLPPFTLPIGLAAAALALCAAWLVLSEPQPIAPPAPATSEPAAVLPDVAASVTSTIDGTLAAALAGWTLCLLLGGLLIMIAVQWRTTVETKEWLLLPSQVGRQLEASLGGLSRAVSQQRTHGLRATQSLQHDIQHTATLISETREELDVLRHELDVKSKEIAALKLGHEFHARRPVLMRVIRALDIIDEDTSSQRDPAGTLEGVKVELLECLEDQSIAIVRPQVGSALSDNKGLDLATAIQVPTTEPEQRGTIAAVKRPAYVVKGPSHDEEVLLPARVQVHV